MTSPTQPDERLGAFLAEPVEPMPERAYVEVRGAMRRTRQQGTVGPMRAPLTPLLAAGGLVALAVVVGLAAWPSLVVGPGSSSSVPTEPVGSAAVPGSTAAAIASVYPFPDCQAPDSEICRDFGPIVESLPGRHPIVVDGIRFTFAIPAAGWEQFGGIALTKSTVRGQAAEAMLYWTAYPSGTIAKRCWRSLGDETGSTLEDATNAIRGSTLGVDVVVAPADTSVGSRPARTIEVVVTEDAGCDVGFFHAFSMPSWGALWWAVDIGTVIRVWVVDVDGKRLFIAGETKPDAGSAVDAEIWQIVASIVFDD